MTDPKQRQRGAALVIVLWVALLLSVALAVALASARIEARISASRENAFLARQAAADGLEFAAQAIAVERAGQIEAISTLEFSINGYDVSFSQAQESEKLDINLANEQTLADFFHFLGEEEENATKLAARVADWRDADDLARPNGAERREYAAARNGERIGNRLFYSADELSLVLGMSPTLAKCAMPALTVFGDGGAPSSTFLTRIYARDMQRSDAASGVQLGTASRSAAAGRRYAITASAKNTYHPDRRDAALTGIFRITGAQTKPYEWIVQFDASEKDAVVDETCGVIN
jgi:general secretion pathway protein K